MAVEMKFFPSSSSFSDDEFDFDDLEAAFKEDASIETIDTLAENTTLYGDNSSAVMTNKKNTQYFKHIKPEVCQGLACVLFE